MSRLPAFAPLSLLFSLRPRPLTTPVPVGSAAIDVPVHPFDLDAAAADPGPRCGRGPGRGGRERSAPPSPSAPTTGRSPSHGGFAAAADGTRGDRPGVRGATAAVAGGASAAGGRAGGGGRLACDCAGGRRGAVRRHRTGPAADRSARTRISTPGLAPSAGPATVQRPDRPRPRHLEGSATDTRSRSLAAARLLPRGSAAGIGPLRRLAAPRGAAAAPAGGAR